MHQRSLTAEIFSEDGCTMIDERLNDMLQYKDQKEYYQNI